MKWAYHPKTKERVESFPTEWSLSYSEPVDDANRPAHTEKISPGAETTGVRPKPVAKAQTA